MRDLAAVGPVALAGGWACAEKIHHTRHVLPSAAAAMFPGLRELSLSLPQPDGEAQVEHYRARVCRFPVAFLTGS